MLGDKKIVTAIIVVMTLLISQTAYAALYSIGNKTGYGINVKGYVEYSTNSSSSIKVTKLYARVTNNSPDPVFTFRAAVLKAGASVYNPEVVQYYPSCITPDGEDRKSVV